MTEPLSDRCLITNNEHALVQQLLVKMHGVKHKQQHLVQINPAVCVVTGLDVHTVKHHGKVSIGACGKRKEQHDVHCWHEAVILLHDLVPREVTCLPGFEDLKLLLSFVSVVCGGNLATMTHTNSIITWLEELLLALQFIWVQTLVRYEDYTKQYCCRQQTLHKVIQIQSSTK